MLFLFRQEALDHFRKGTDIDPDRFYEFFAWDFGPFSVQVYDDLTFFLLRGFIEATPSDDEPLPESEEEWVLWQSFSTPAAWDEEVDPYRDEVFRLREPRGVTFARALYETLSEPQQRLLKEFKARTSTVPLRALVRYVYERYPGMTEKSKIKGQVLGSR